VSAAKNTFKLAMAVASISCGVATTIHAYGLTVQSWPWLVGGTVCSFLLLSLAQIGDD
jgi:hypothetical protein